MKTTCNMEQEPFDAEQRKADLRACPRWILQKLQNEHTLYLKEQEARVEAEKRVAERECCQALRLEITKLKQKLAVSKSGELAASTTSHSAVPSKVQQLQESVEDLTLKLQASNDLRKIAERDLEDEISNHNRTKQKVRSLVNQLQLAKAGNFGYVSHLMPSHRRFQIQHT